MPLFETGDFTLASGAKSRFKIECDALTDADWDALAVMLVERLPPFSTVLGVPRGGLPLAAALRRYETFPGDLLVVDDVWTTGGSMQRYIESSSLADVRSRPIHRAVVFARNPTPADVVALFTMSPGPPIA